METQLTPRQIAGAANGRLAAGAKSPEGRARSAANATKHGLTAQSLAQTPQTTNRPTGSITLVNESQGAFEDLCLTLANCFHPSDAHEMYLVHRMAQSEWLRQRAVQMEAAALSEAMRQQAHPFHANAGSEDLAPADSEALRTWHAFSKLASSNPAFATLQRYAATHARAYSRTERELRDYRKAKAESIHPTPQPEGPVAGAELTPAPTSDHDPESRWKPLQTIAAPEEDNPTDAPPTPENTLDETKVTAPLETLAWPLTWPPTWHLAEAPHSEAEMPELSNPPIPVINKDIEGIE
jgi:hypothetical protein